MSRSSQNRLFRSAIAATGHEFCCTGNMWPPSLGPAPFRTGNGTRMEQMDAHRILLFVTDEAL